MPSPFDLTTWARAVPRSVRNLSRRPGQTLRWLAGELAYSWGKAGHIELAPGWSLRCHPACSRSLRLYGQDPSLRAELDGFLAHCRPSMVLFDVGANFGLFSIAALMHGGEHAHVVAVDPSPASNRYLRANLRLNGLTGRCQVVEGAVGAADGELAMLTTGPAGDHYMVAAATPRVDATRVPQMTLHTLARRTDRTPTHVKIDVEGFEREVVRGGADFLRRHRPLLFLELHGAMIRARGECPRGVLEDLVACGYRSFEEGGRPVSLEAAAQSDLVRLVCRPVLS
jgi:FkbM family methyltransferase